MNLRLAAALMIIAATSCGKVRPCKDGTLLVDVSFGGDGIHATLIKVTVETDAQTITGTTAHQDGVVSGSLEVTFGNGYPAGQTATVTIEAQSNGITVATGKSVPLQLTSKCLKLAVDLADTETQDLLTPSDMAQPDLSTPACEGVTVSTLAGNGIAAFVDGTGGGQGTTSFNQPAAVAISGSYVYVADYINNRIRRVASDGSTITVAGNGTQGFVDGTGGPTGTTEFFYPTAIAADSSGNVYVADEANSRVRKVAPNGTTTTLTSGGYGYFDGTGGSGGTTRFRYVSGVALDKDGFLYASDEGDYRVRRIASDGSTTTLSGNGTKGFVDGTGGAFGTTELGYPHHLTVDQNYNVYLADSTNQAIRKIAADGTTTTLAGNGNVGHIDGTGGKTGTTQFSDLLGVVVDNAGNLYASDDTWIRRIDPTGATTTIAGTGVAGYADGSGCVAQFRQVDGLAMNGKTLIVADAKDHRIRMITLP